MLRINNQGPGPMTVLFRLGLAAALGLAATGASLAVETRDIKGFVKEAFKDQIDAVKSGMYCLAFSCQFEVETFYATETDPKTYALSMSGWLEGTVPGLKGSARRAMGLTGTYTQGTCVVKDLKPIYDTLTNNNGWGASKIESVFKRIHVPPTVVLAPEICQKVDSLFFHPS